MTPVKTGDFVVVQADRGEDLGVVTDSFTLPIFLEKRYSMRAYMDEEDQNVSYILRLASPTELKLLPEKFQDEEMIFKVLRLCVVLRCSRGVRVLIQLQRGALSTRLCAVMIFVASY
jgi:hypothetical protein